jgi:hypothetical protein
MSTNSIEMEIKSVGKKIEYKKPKGVTSSLCAVKTVDDKGNEHKAYAWGQLCDDIKVGSKVLVTKWFSPKKEEKSDSFIILKLL